MGNGWFAGIIGAVAVLVCAAAWLIVTSNRELCTEVRSMMEEQREREVVHKWTTISWRYGQNPEDVFEMPTIQYPGEDPEAWAARAYREMEVWQRAPKFKHWAPESEEK